jgi:hypothetical protein
MTTIKFQDFKSKKSFDIDSTKIEIIGNVVLIAYDPINGDRMAMLYPTPEEIEMVQAAQTDHEYMISKKNQYFSKQKRVKTYNELTSAWKDFFEWEEIKKIAEDYQSQEYNKLKNECNQEADDAINNARRQFEQIKSEYDKTMVSLQPFLY